MWAKQLFKAFRQDDTTKEKELIKFLPNKTKNALPSIKSVYRKRRQQGMTPFIVAILHNDVELCEQLIEEGIDFGQQSPSNQISFTFADNARFDEFNNRAADLIKLGPNSDIFKDFNKTTPMYWAIQCDKVGLVDKLIHSGQNMNAAVEKLQGTPTLCFAILCNNVPIVKHLLLKQLCDIHENTNRLDVKPLDLAIQLRKTEMVRLLLMHKGEDVNCKIHNTTPLLQAVFLNDLKMTSFILGMGANVDFGMSNGNLIPPLHLAIQRGNYEIAHFLLEKGADVTLKDYTDSTALYLLVERVNLGVENLVNGWVFKLARLLLKKGAKVDVANASRDNPLLLAVIMHEPQLVDVFLSVPVELNNLLGKTKVTILHFACSPLTILGPLHSMFHQTANRPIENHWKVRCSIVESLIRNGADVNKQSMDGRTSLHYAAESGGVQLVKLLIDSKVDINKVSASGKTALHHAAHNGSFKVIKLMLEAGAEVNARDSFGLTPIGIGVMLNQSFSYDAAKLLFDYGADICRTDAHGAFHLYNTLIVKMRTDLMKLFWREGLAYDYVIGSTKKDLLGSVQSYLQHIGEQTKLAVDFSKRFNNQSWKQVEELMKAQGQFINGVEMNNVKLVLDALQKGAEVGGSSMNIPFPLNFLAKKGYTDVAHVLLSKGVRTNTVDLEGKLPTDLAVEFGHYRMYLTLLQYGACYNSTSFDKSLFQRRGSDQCQKVYLLIKKAFNNVKQGDHCILKDLNKFVTSKTWDVYHALMNCVDDEGRTLMESALERGDSFMARKLMEYRLLAPDNSALQPN